MARIKKLVHRPMERNSLHDEVDCAYSVFGSDDRLILQIDTFGRAERDLPGKKSQTIQFDKESAQQLFELLRDTYHF